MTNSQDPGGAYGRVMTRSEVASWLAVSVPTLMARVRAGDIPASRIGGEWRFWRPTLESHLFSQEAPVEANGREANRREADVITTGQLGEILQLSAESIRARIEDGSIPASKIGNHYRIYWPTIRARLEAGEDFGPKDRPSAM